LKKNFIIGSVWTAVVVGVISFVTTVHFLDKNSNDSQADKIDRDVSRNNQQVVYETNQSSIRTNDLANLDKNTVASKIDKVIENNINNQIKNEEIIDAEELLLIEELEKSEEEAIVETANITSFVKPINGEIINPLSVEELVYSKTLKEWNVHKGTDYEAQLGDEVYAIRKGIIKEINFNYIYGDYIVIEFDGGFEALYSNITVFDALKVGDVLEQGQVIGYVAESFGFEVEEKTHLHFELKRDGEYISI